MKINCCICGQEITGLGNNPRPVKDSGRCCDMCNVHVVIPERIKRITNSRKEEQTNEKGRNTDKC